ncbi:MAG: transporter substrate-binding domain-containing protein [Gammaproteobacteria bacterium]|nr:transporter substrate-binding domain-containing protein [Gammaproteobacteria bacterium]
MLRVSLILVALAFSACAPKSPEPASDDTNTPAVAAAGPTCRLTMGWDAWEPYHYRDVGGAVHGLDIELVTAIVNKAGCEISFDQEDWSTLLGRLRSGAIDILSGATRTASREKFAWFSEPYRSESFQLYVRSGESVKYNAADLEALLANGITVGTTLEYVYGQEVDALQDNPDYASQFLGAAIGELNIDRLLSFEIDSLLEDPFVAATVIRKKGLEEKIEAHPLIVSTGSVHLMFSKA